MELTKLSKLKTNPRNPRTITEAQFERLKDSLLVFPKMLTLRPLATDGNGIVLGGNMRLRALKDIAKMTAEQIAERLQGMKTYNQKSEAATLLKKRCLYLMNCVDLTLWNSIKNIVRNKVI